MRSPSARPLQIRFPFALSSPCKSPSAPTFLQPATSLISSSMPMDFGFHHVVLINVSAHRIVHHLHRHLTPSYKPQLPSSLSNRIVTSHRFLSSRVLFCAGLHRNAFYACALCVCNSEYALYTLLPFSKCYFHSLLLPNCTFSMLILH